MKEYEEIRFLSEKLGLSGFTKLQEKAFRGVLNYDMKKWLFVIGATSSGKTLIPLLNYFREYIIRKRKGEKHRMLFAVPYRALAAQKRAEIEEFTSQLQLNLNIVLSTGEFRSDDINILNGSADIAVIIYEKVFMFYSMKNELFNLYDLLVLDEIGLTQSRSRGIKADFILLQAAMHDSLRVIALGTPFYNWNNYIQMYDFIRIEENERPINVKTYPVFYTRDGVNHVEEECKAVHEGSFPVLNNNMYEMNPKQRRDFVIEDICTYHLKKNHKILIFENNRQEVHLLARRLAKSLSLKGFLSEWIDEVQCKRYIRQEMQIDNADELFGIMDLEDYYAFARGVGYHNADVPMALRSLIEKEFLEKEGNLRIVCSTETLVYGINSNADVVIIPNLMKQHLEDGQQNDFLYANEYMNYAGRAGRLDSDIPIGEQKHIGYIYPFIKDVYYDTSNGMNMDSEKNQKRLWEKLQMEIQNPELISSCYFDVNQLERPLYLLALFPNDRNLDSDARTITLDRLRVFLKKIPGLEENDFDDKIYVKNPLSLLLERRLITIANDCDDEDDDFEPEYQLTDTGKKLTGYVINIEDLDKLMQAACRSITAMNMYKVDILLGIIETKEITEHILRQISFISDYYPQLFESAVKEMKCVYLREHNHMSKQISEKLKKELHKYETWIVNKYYKNLANDNNFQRQRLLYALLIWSDEQYTIKKIYETLALNYMQIKRFAEMISYRLDIIKCVLSVARDDAGKNLYQQLGYIRIHEAEEWVQELSDEIFYRVPAHICKFLNIQCAEPHKAIKVRNAAKIYDYLSNILKKDCPPNKKERNKIKNIMGKIKTWETEWQNAFYNRFGGILKDGN